MRSLKREYRTRVFVMFLFFISIAVIIGILSLFPAYIFSYSQGQSSFQKIQTLEKNREARDIKNISKELKESYQIIKKLKANENISRFSETISEITKLRPAQVTLTSFQLSKSGSATSSTEAIVQGKAISRESLLLFKKKLEDDQRITKVELPVSDLTKPKNISFAIRITFVE